MTLSEVHSAYYVDVPQQWVLYVSHEAGTRLVVFIHGFGGKAISTWDDFRRSSQYSPWWAEADLLFIGYESTKDNITAVANRIRSNISRFYPIPYQPAMTVSGVQARADVETAYTELIILGHSLGGLIARRCVVDAAQEWIDHNRVPDRPGVLDGQLRLFSPASAGFRDAGLLGVLKASSFWPAFNMYLRHTSAYTDLQPGSTTLVDTRRRTERFAADFEELGVLRAQILWANPDNIVIAERYDTDWVDSTAEGTSHRSVCKPNGAYTIPWQFAERGRIDG